MGSSRRQAVQNSSRRDIRHTSDGSRLKMVLKSSMNDDDNVEREYAPINGNDDDDGENFDIFGGKDGDDSKQRKLIQISSRIELPFSAEVAYEAYSNLSRQPSWSSWLESVVVLNDDDDENHGGEEQKVESRWTIKVMGIRYSWTAEAVQNVRPRTIQWRSVTGLRNEGIVRFHRTKGKSYDEEPTLMTLNMAFETPKAVTAILRRSKRLSNFVEEKMIAQSLKDFRDIVMENDVTTTANGVESSKTTLR